jgi:hypothetical protein
MTNIVEVPIMKGWTLPFFPMRPVSGPDLTRKLALTILDQMDDHRYIFQPKLNGDRALLGIAEGRVFVCNRHYNWYQYQVANAGAFKAKLGNGTLFDGEVFKSNFYPFDCLAVEGRSFKANTTDQREVEAMQMCRLCGVEWAYRKPTKKWLLAGRANLPKWEGVVRKRADLAYVLLTNASGTSPGWLKHKF